jgi:hypothetical protein
MGSEDLEGHPSAQSQVFGEIDDARATVADDLLDPMAGEERADPSVHREVVALRPYGEQTGRRAGEVRGRPV